MKRIFLLLSLLILLFKVKAQQLVQERIYRVNSLVKGSPISGSTKEGNVILSGNYVVNSNIQSLLMLVKPNTDTLWIRKGPILSTGGQAIKQAPSRGFAFYTTKGYTNPTTSGTILQKYDANGFLKWTMPYATNNFDTGHLLLTAPDSGYFIGGKNILATKQRRFTLGRTDSLGNLKWRKSYDWAPGDFLGDIQHAYNGNIIMYGTSGTPQRLKLLLVNQNGDSILGRILNLYNSSRNERLNSSACNVTPLSDNGFLMAAEIDTNVTGAPPRMGMVVKVNASLQPVWHYINRSLPNNVVFSRSRELADGSVVVVAHSRQGTASSLSNQFFFYRFSANGSLLNVYPFASSAATQVQITAFESLPDSSFMVAGTGVVTPFPNYSAGFYIAKVKIPGLAPALPLPGAMVVTGIKSEQSFVKASLGQSYPNPTSETSIIPYTLPSNYQEAKILIRDITGREVGNYNVKPNTSSLEVNLSNLNNGLYNYTLIVNDKPIATKKLAVSR